MTQGLINYILAVTQIINCISENLLVTVAYKTYGRALGK